MNGRMAILAALTEDDIIAYRLRQTVFLKADITRLGIHIGAMELEEDEWEVGWTCSTCRGSGGVIYGRCANDPFVQVYECSDCVNGIRWENKY
jgi:hypothetical protein